MLKEVRNASGSVAASVGVETAELDVPEADLAFMRDALNGVATDNADVSKLLNEQGIDPALRWRARRVPPVHQHGRHRVVRLLRRWTIRSTWWPAWSSTAAAVRPWRRGREGSGGCACQRVRGGSGAGMGVIAGATGKVLERGRRDVRQPYH
ncbi:MAG: hypothetical protein ACLSGS_04245 [Adlercreutzia sp.]